MPEKPNILEIRYIAVQYSKDVFIYLYRGRVSDLRLRSEARVETARWAKTTDFTSLPRHTFLTVSLFSRFFPVGSFNGLSYSTWVLTTVLHEVHMFDIERARYCGRFCFFGISHYDGVAISI